MTIEFDLQEGRRLALEGERHALSAARVEEWKRNAELWFNAQASGSVITADSLIEAVGLPDEGINRNNSVGGFFSSLRHRGKIVFTGNYIPSARVVRHANPQREWRIV